jgi:transcription-repair coupling factor (superfamily II helicase)
LNNKEEAAYYLNDLEQMIGEQDVLFYRIFSSSYEIEDTDNANVLLRAEVLNRINSRRNQPLLSPIRSLIWKVVTRKELDKTRWKLLWQIKFQLILSTKYCLNTSSKELILLQNLENFLRGGIVDVFFSNDNPYRINFLEMK